MKLLEQYIACMQSGDNVGLADLFAERGVLHDSSLLKIGKDTLHLEGRMVIEMMFHHKFGFNRGPFPIHSVRYHDESIVKYFIEYGGILVSVTAMISEFSPDGKIQRLNIYPL